MKQTSFAILLLLSLGLTQCKKNNAIETTVHTVVLQPGPEAETIYVQEIIPVNTERTSNKEAGAKEEGLLIAARWNSIIHPEQQSWRSLLRFSALSQIPAQAKVKTARLYLSGVSSSDLFPDGNSSFDGSRRSANTSVLQRLTSAWNKNEVNWFNMPQATNEGEVMIPPSDRQWNYNVTLDVTDMVREMVSQPEKNYGFVLRLQNDDPFTAVLFASSSSKDESARPRLVVEAEY